MPRGGLTPEQNQRVRECVRELLARRYNGNQTELAFALGFKQPMVSNFLSGNRGTTYAMVEAVAKLMRVPEWQVLGKPPPPGVPHASAADVAREIVKTPEFEAVLGARPLASLHPREIAAIYVHQIGVSDRAIASVLAVPLTPETERWQMLWWADLMRERHVEMLAEAGGRGRRRKGRP